MSSEKPSTLAIVMFSDSPALDNRGHLEVREVPRLHCSWMCCEKTLFLTSTALFRDLSETSCGSKGTSTAPMTVPTPPFPRRSQGFPSTQVTSQNTIKTITGLEVLNGPHCGRAVSQRAWVQTSVFLLPCLAQPTLPTRSTSS